MKNIDLYVGIDVSKQRLDGAICPSGETFQFANTPEGHIQLLARLQALEPQRVVLEATGGYEAPVATLLATYGLPVVIVNPRLVRRFGQALGRLAKTDRLDAKLIARYAQSIQPPVRLLPEAARQELQALLSRRRQLVEMKVDEECRLQRAPQSLQAGIDEHLVWLKERIQEMDQTLHTQLRANDLWREIDDRLQSVPGVGPTTSCLLVASLPELGQLNRQQIAALVGLAPFNHDSGSHQGERKVWGGRSTIRATLYMATLSATRWNPLIRTFYQRLLSVGKARKVALVACMRKLLLVLNAIVKQKRDWSYLPQPT